MDDPDIYNSLRLSVAIGPMPDAPPSSLFELSLTEPAAGIGRGDLELLREIRRGPAVALDQAAADSAARQAIARRYPVEASALNPHGESSTGDSMSWTLT